MMQFIFTSKRTTKCYMAARQNLLSRFFVLLVLTAFIAAATPVFAAQQKVWFTSQHGTQAASEISPIQITEKTEQKVSFQSVALYGYFTDVEKNGQSFVRVRLPGGGVSGEIGRPELPVYGKFIAVPEGAQVQLIIDSVETEPIDGTYTVLPMQPPVPDTDAPPPEFTMDNETYQTDAYLNEKEVVKITQDVIVRGKRLVYVVYQPALYNPAQSKIKTAWRVNWHLEYVFLKKTANATTAVFLSIPWEKDFSNTIGDMVLDALPATKAVEGTVTLQAAAGQASEVTGDGADYLIIVHDDFVDAIQPLVEWKFHKGYKVKVTKLSEIDSQLLTRIANVYTFSGDRRAESNAIADIIRNYIQGMYSKTPRMLYLLLVGDTQQLPPYYYSQHSGDSTPDPFGGIYIATDLYYASLENTMSTYFFPDGYVGRLPCATAAECSTMINKILTIEKTPPGGSTYYNNALVAGQFSDSEGTPDGIEDRYFIETTEAVKDFLENNTTRTYTVQTSYMADSIVTPRLFNGSSIMHTGEDPYTNKIGSQTYRGALDAINTIDTSVNNGVWLVQHRDHGGSTGWGTPAYSTANVNGLSNGTSLPWVNSINCLTGRFDLFTHDAANNIIFLDCFAEAWLKKQGGGAYAVIAATRVTYSGTNDHLTHGLYQCFNPSYLSTLAGLRGYAQDISPYVPVNNDTPAGTHLGQILTYGKMYLYDQLPSTSRREDFELFHLFGCPEQEPRIVAPREFKLENVSRTFAGSQIVIDATVKDKASSQAVPNARVAFIIDSAQTGTKLYTGTTSSTGTIHCAIATSIDANVRCTVTRSDYLPYETTMGSAVFITVSEPAAGEDLLVGSSKTITWSSKGFSGNVQIQLGTPSGCGYTWSDIPNGSNTANDGSHSWTVSGSPAANCVIKVSSIADQNIYGQSEPFDIVAPALSVTPTTLNFSASQGGANPATQTFSIRNTGGGTLNWTASESSSWISSVSPASGSITTGPDTVSVSVNTAGLVAGTYISSVAVGSNGGSASVAVNITIANITVTSPEAGEDWQVGTTHSITWTSSGVSGNVQIQLGIPAGCDYTWSDIPGGTSTANDGSHSWTVSGNAAENCVIKISCVSNPNFLGQSQPFNIVSPTTTTSSVRPSTTTSSVRPSTTTTSVRPSTTTTSVRPSTTTTSIATTTSVRTTTTTSIAPSLYTSPSSFSFSYTVGGATPANQTLSIRNTGGGTLNWSVSYPSANNWINASPPTGSSTGETDTVSIGLCNLASLSPGTHTGTITVDSNGGTHTKTITLTVNPNQAPLWDVLFQNQTVDENVTLNYYIPTAIDPEGNTPVSYSYVSMPGDAIFYPLLRLFQWKPSYDAVPAGSTSKNYTIIVRTTDSLDNYRDGTFTVTVNNVNRAPGVLVSIAWNTLSNPLLLNVGETLQLGATGSDLDTGDTLQYLWELGTSATMAGTKTWQTIRGWSTTSGCFYTVPTSGVWIQCRCTVKDKSGATATAYTSINYVYP